MKGKRSARPFSVWLLIFLQVFLGLNGLYGGCALMLAPDGSLLQMPLRDLAKAPFPDFFIPGMLLFVFLGLYPLAAAYSLWKAPAWRWPDAINPFRHLHWSWAGSLAAGVIAVLWIAIQMLWIPFWFLQAFILGWGVLIILVTVLPGVRRAYARSAASA